MINISDAVPVPNRETAKKLQARRSLNNLIKRFQEAHRQVYGRTPFVEYQDPWIKIDSQKTRVNVSRLKEMSRQLEGRLL